MSDVTQILAAIEAGDADAAGQLLPVVYDELRKLAAINLARESPGQTLQATALVHEAYVRLVGDAHFENRGHFFAAAAEAMRRILIDNARRKKRQKHGGMMRRVDLEDVVTIDEPADRLLALDEALERLASHDPLAARLVMLRYFAGMPMSEAAAALGISLRTAERNWTYARTWLHRELSDAD